MSIALPVFTPIEETLYLTRSSSTWGPGWTPGCSASPPPDTADWYDVDFPEVITARRQLLPKRANAHSIGTDLTNSDWLDAIPTNAIWAAKHYHGTQSVADLIRSPGFDDPHQPERWNPRLRLVEEILLTRKPEVAEFPTALRLFTRLAAHSTALSRRGTTVLHYRF